MENLKKLERRTTSLSVGSQAEECESFWYLYGPPFTQRDYMMSPSESGSCNRSDFIAESATAEKAPEISKRKLRPSDIKIDSKYLLDSRKALTKLSDLLKEGLAENFVDRLEDLIQIFLQGSPAGFLVDDLSLVIEIVEFFSRNRASAPKYTTFVKMIMAFSNEPPKVGKASHVLRFKDVLIDYFTLFGELLATFEDECFQLSLLEALDGLIIRRKLVDLCCIKLSFCHEAMEASQLPCVVAALMETVPYSLYIHYLELALQIIWVSVRAGYAMARSNIIEFVLRRMDSFSSKYCFEEQEKDDETYEYYKLLDKSAYLIWSLFAIITKYNVEIPVPKKEALRTLKNVFLREAKKKSPKAVQTRNCWAGILVKLYAVIGDRLALKETGLDGDIVALAVATEVKAQIDWIAEIDFDINNDDYMLKKLMLCCCCLFSKSQDLISTLKTHKIIEGALLLINPKTTLPWIPSQFVNLLAIGFSTLTVVVPKLPEVYVESEGNSRLLSTIKWLMEEYFDQNSMLEALKTFCAIITCDLEIIIEDAKAQGAVPVLLDVCSRLLNVTFMKLEHQEKMSRIFMTLETLLKNDPKYQTDCADFCVSVAIKLLQRILANSENDSKWNWNLFLSFGGFLWEAIAWCSTSLKIFIEKGGIFLFLDFVESSSFPVQMLFLGILVDMTDEGETIAHLLTWRGKDGGGILSMMIDIWRKEEYLTKVHRTNDGLILDLDAPLMTEEQWYLTHQVKGSHIYSPSIAEMIGSARPKIHALYQFLQWRYFELTQIGESAYCLHLKMIKPSHQVYIPLIEHYLAFKMGEIWAEVVRDVNISGVLPSAFDGNVVCTLLDERNKWSIRVRRLQEDILTMQQGGDAGEERKLYEFLRGCQQPSALEAVHELDYVARTSFQKFQRRKKNRQIEQVNKTSALTGFRHYSNSHSVFMFDGNTTFMDFRTVWIKSEKVGEETEDLSLVSPLSICDNMDYSDDF